MLEQANEQLDGVAVLLVGGPRTLAISSPRIYRCLVGKFRPQ
jgi:hypothetical protein